MKPHPSKRHLLLISKLDQVVCIGRSTITTATEKKLLGIIIDSYRNGKSSIFHMQQNEQTNDAMIYI